MEHMTVYYKKEMYAAWPANNGVWMWDGREIVVGFTLGQYEVTGGLHNIGRRATKRLARSRDGGRTWYIEKPDFRLKSRDLAELPHPIDFSKSGLGMHVLGAKYHGSQWQQGGFFFTYDRGRRWRGPFGFTGLEKHPELNGLSWTPRTDYVIYDPRRCLVMLSAQKNDLDDRIFCAHTTDGGRSFEFLGWMVSFDDPYRAVMSSTIRTSEGDLVSAVRRRTVVDKHSVCWIDAFRSQDNGNSWTLLSKIGDTGSNNGNPPALVRMTDGRLCCVYGRRDRRQMVARISSDGGENWGAEWVLRQDFPTDGRPDFGYPRVVQRSDGALVVMYYWSTRLQPEQHIAATIWRPEPAR